MCAPSTAKLPPPSETTVAFNVVVPSPQAMVAVKSPACAWTLASLKVATCTSGVEIPSVALTDSPRGDERGTADGRGAVGTRRAATGVRNRHADRVIAFFGIAVGALDRKTAVAKRDHRRILSGGSVAPIDRRGEVAGRRVDVGIGEGSDLLRAAQRSLDGRDRSPRGIERSVYDRRGAAGVGRAAAVVLDRDADRVAALVRVSMRALNAELSVAAETTVTFCVVVPSPQVIVAVKSLASALALAPLKVATCTTPVEDPSIPLTLTPADALVSAASTTVAVLLALAVPPPSSRIATPDSVKVSA